MKKKIFKTFAIVAMAMVAMLVSCGSNSAKEPDIQEAVDAVNETTPAPSWDGESLKSVSFEKADNVVVLNIKNVSPYIHVPEESSEQDIKKAGYWYIANFMTGYDWALESDEGEGDADMYRALGDLLKLMAEKDMGVRFKLDFEAGGTTTFNMSAKDLKKAVEMRKSDYRKEFDD